jgi:hypothetical protein
MKHVTPPALRPCAPFAVLVARWIRHVVGLCTLADLRIQRERSLYDHN